MLAKHPERVIEKSVKGMLPKNKLGAQLFRNLKVYAGAEHSQEAQQPKAINLNDLKMEVIHKIGRRKTAVARVYVSPGSGEITVNKKKMEEYFLLLHYNTK